MEEMLKTLQNQMDDALQRVEARVWEGAYGAPFIIIIIIIIIVIMCLDVPEDRISGLELQYTPFISRLYINTFTQH